MRCKVEKRDKQLARASHRKRDNLRANKIAYRQQNNYVKRFCLYSTFVLSIYNFWSSERNLMSQILFYLCENDYQATKRMQI